MLPLFSRKLILLLLLCTLPAMSQSVTGTLTGLVSDTSGASVAGATVEARNQGTGVVGRATTSEFGSYTIPQLAPGDYTVTVTFRGFKTTTQSGVKVATAQTITCDLTLEVGDMAEKVTVTAESPLVNSNSAAVTTTVENRTIQDLPMVDKSMLGAVLLAPGVQGDPQYNGGVQSELPGIFTQPVTPGASISVGGGRPGNASILVDGSDVTSAGYARTIMTFSGDTVQEVSVQANGIPAQFGRTTSAVINQSTRSGSNQYHGSAQWGHIDPYFQTQALGASFPPTQQYNQFGVSIGGPVIIPKVYDGRNKTFFYGTFEPQRQKLLYGAQRTRLPTADELQGNFYNSWDFLDRTLRQQNVAAAIASPIRVFPLRYHYPINSQGFPNGPLINNSADWPIIPGNNVSSQLKNNPTAQKIVSTLYPFTPGTDTPYIHWLQPSGLWETDGNNAIYARGVSSVDNRFSIKLDQIIGSNARVSVRYSEAPVTGTRFDWAGPDAAGNPLAQDEIYARNAMLTYNQTISPTMFNELRVSYSRGDAIRAADNESLSQDWGAYFGLVPAAAGYGFPQLLGRGLNADGGLNGKSIDVNLGFSDDFSWVKGRHNIKVGGEFRHIQLNRYQIGGATGGNYSFAGQITPNESGVSLYSFIDQLGGLATGSLNTYSYRTVQNVAYYRWKYGAAYFQDDFRVTKTLTLNLGLRYDIETPRREKYNNQGSFDPDIKGSYNGQPVQGAYVWSGTRGLGETLWPVNYKGFQPRIGLVWAAKPWVNVRASYSYLRAPITGLGLDIFPDSSVPLTTLRSTNNTGGVNPGPINIVTNPIGPLPPPITLGRDPIFSMNGSYDFTFAYIPQNDDMPYAQKWGAGIQFLAWNTMSIELGYEGTKGTNLFATSLPLNAVPWEQAAPLVSANSDFNSTSINYNPLKILGPNGQPLTGRLLDSMRAYPNWFNRIIRTGWDRSGNSIYHGASVAFNKRFSKGFSVQGAYTFSKSIDDGSNNLQTTQIADSWGVVNSQWYNRKLERSVSTYDLTHRFNTAFTWELPFGRGQLVGNDANPWLNALIGGYQIGGFIRIASGPPMTAYNGSTGWFNSRGGGSGLEFFTLRPDRVLDVPVINPDWRGDPFRRAYLNPAAFAVPGKDGLPAMGNAPPTLPDVRGPATQAFDASIMKNIRWGRDVKWTVQLRADVFNVMNHPVFFVNPGRSNVNAFNFTGGTRVWTPNNVFSTVDANNTAQFNNYSGRSFRVGARLMF